MYGGHSLFIIIIAFINLMTKRFLLKRFPVKIDFLFNNWMALKSVFVVLPVLNIDSIIISLNRMKTQDLKPTTGWI